MPRGRLKGPGRINRLRGGKTPRVGIRPGKPGNRPRRRSRKRVSPQRPRPPRRRG